jgi:hypothetical protein
MGESQARDADTSDRHWNKYVKKANIKQYVLHDLGIGRSGLELIETSSSDSECKEEGEPEEEEMQEQRQQLIVNDFEMQCIEEGIFDIGNIVAIDNMMEGGISLSDDASTMESKASRVINMGEAQETSRKRKGKIDEGKLEYMPAGPAGAAKIRRLLKSSKSVCDGRRKGGSSPKVNSNASDAVKRGDKQWTE